MPTIKKRKNVHTSKTYNNQNKQPNVVNQINSVWLAKPSKIHNYYNSSMQTLGWQKN